MSYMKNDVDDPRRDYFDSYADGWDGHEPSAAKVASRLEQAQKLLKFEHGMSVIEIGCGTGKTTSWIVDTVGAGNVVAVDFSSKMIEQAIKKPIEAEFVCADVCQAPPVDRQFDVVFCFHCFPHFRDQAAGLINLTENLKPDGRLIIMHLAGSEHINSFHINLPDPICTDLLCEKDQWPGLLAEANLKCDLFIDSDEIFFLEATRKQD